MSTLNLQEICEQALNEGKKIELTRCTYDYVTPEDNTPGYYYFLSGLVKSQKISNIFEIGTYMGGSIIAMSKGLNESDIPNCKLLTVDIVSNNSSELNKYPHIKKIQGDALHADVIKEVQEYFNKGADLLFIDSNHTYSHVKRCIATYANKLKPNFIVLDDIHYNDSIEKLWQELTKEFKGQIIDLTEMVDRKNCGFGLLYWNHAFRNKLVYAGYLLSIRESLRNFLLLFIPSSLKTKIRKYITDKEESIILKKSDRG